MENSRARTSTQGSNGSPRHQNKIGLPRHQNKIGLPKIGKNINSPSSLSLRFQYLTRDKDYCYCTEKQLRNQYKKLREGLQQLNECAIKIVNRMNNKSLKSNRKPEVQQVRYIQQKEKDNNDAIITRLKYQLQQLQKRVGQIGITGKYSLDDAIQENKLKIKEMRHNNKQLMQKSKKLGQKIDFGDAVFEQGADLQFQCGNATRRLSKLKKRFDETNSDIKKLEKSILQITQDYSKANHFIEEEIQCLKIVQTSKNIQSDYQKQVNKMDAIKYSCQSIVAVKTQTYHQKLKLLQAIQSRIDTAQKQIKKVQEDNILKVQTMGILQKEVNQTSKLKVAKEDQEKTQHAEQNLVFFTELQSKSQNKETKQKQDKKPIKVNTINRYSTIQRSQINKKEINLIKSTNVHLKQNTTLPVRIKQQKKHSNSVFVKESNAESKTIDQPKKQASTKQRVTIQALTKQKQTIQVTNKEKQTTQIKTKQRQTQKKSNQDVVKIQDQNLKTVKDKEGAFQAKDSVKNKRNIIHFENKNIIVQDNKKEKESQKLIKKEGYTIQVEPCQSKDKGKETQQKSQLYQNTKKIQQKERSEQKLKIVEDKNLTHIQSDKKEEKIIVTHQKSQAKLQVAQKQQEQIYQDSFDFQQEIKNSRTGWQQARAKIDIQLDEIDECLRRQAQQKPKQKPKRNHFAQMIIQDGTI